jgi:hypothetical protein
VLVVGEALLLGSFLVVTWPTITLSVSAINIFANIWGDCCFPLFGGTHYRVDGGHQYSGDRFNC